MSKKVEPLACIIKNVTLKEFFCITASAYTDPTTGKTKGKPQFTAKCAIDLSDPDGEIKKLKQLSAKACKGMWGENYKKAMKNEKFHHAIRNADTCKFLEDDFGNKKPKKFDPLKGNYYFKVKANETRRPGFGIKKGNQIVEIDDDKEIAKHFYPGAIVQVAMSILPYSKPGIGYGFWVDGFILVDKGERMYGKAKPLNSVFNMEELLKEVEDVTDVTDVTESDEFEGEFDDDVEDPTDDFDDEIAF